MAAGWYPVIDQGKCLKCHECVNFCPHDVYTIGVEAFPEVVHPVNCVQFCRGCSKICDNDAISYFGDKRR
ncbi:MAG: 4Fe-4S dicluster domain-containing protein [Candidatus Cryosericum sp.]